MMHNEECTIEYKIKTKYCVIKSLKFKKNLKYMCVVVWTYSLVSVLF
jgi:hypothetical protein